jgi:hypothetical protein
MEDERGSKAGISGRRRGPRKEKHHRPHQPLTPAALLGDVVVIRHGKPFSKRKSYFIQSLDNRPDYPGLPEKSVYVGLANKNAANLITAQKAKTKRKEAEEAAKLSKVEELIKKARL